MISLPEIIPKFNKQYPNVEIRYVDSLSSELEMFVEEGNLDFAIVLSGKPNKKLIEVPLLKDFIYLCVPDSLLKEYYGDESEGLKLKSLSGANVEDFCRLPFAMYSNRLGKSIYECFEVAGCEPKVRFTTSFSQLLLPLCVQGIAACFIARMNLANAIDQFDGKVNIFPLFFEGKAMIQELSLIRHKDKYLPNYAKDFLEIIYDYFVKLEQVDLTRVCK